MSSIALPLLLVLSSTAFTAAKSIGVCYGVNGDNLPSKQEVINLYKSNGIGGIHIYSPDEETLQALRGSNIEVLLDVATDTIPSLTHTASAKDWVNKFVVSYSPDVNFKYIVVGNEISPTDQWALYILPAMQNIQQAISAANLEGQIKVPTAIDISLVKNSYPPGNGAFTDDASGFIKPIVTFLSNNGAPLLAKIYPYFSYTENQQSIPLAYALFTQQGTNDMGYQNVFDAMLDSMYAALEKIGAPTLQIVVSETGWPSGGYQGASVGNATTYYKNLINHVKGGTPKRPFAPIETYLSAMFDENMESGMEFVRHFGLFNADKSPKYGISFNSSHSVEQRIMCIFSS
ncbi:hypothetical protein QN277_019254 [Acacia crassicarpa]|uniref:glucan endo-1,3-beta-D-glucosidase n=1 Tax=Acacia crassicarpa TaxID=499986 RepID=A0AAE1KIU0_9FABA|nr:hypothetical protein QN277_019254 [Acacia crassicarpa]